MEKMDVITMLNTAKFKDANCDYEHGWNGALKTIKEDLLKMEPKDE